MLIKAVSFLAGVCAIQQLAQLPAAGFMVFPALLLLLWWKFRSRRYQRWLQSLSIVAIGALWASLHAYSYLEQRLPESQAGQDVLIEGVIQGIPLKQGRVQRFVVEVSDIEPSAITALAPQLRPQKLRISWYHAKETVHAGERWRLWVRLKPPHGFLNPGGFDYEAWLYQQGIHATGYVRKNAGNTRLASAGLFSVDARRQQLSQHIQRNLYTRSHAGLITALAVGDRSPISKQHWDTLINTGTNHLMAISGLHIGLAAAFGFWVARRLIPVRAMKRVPAQQCAISLGLLVAVLYALLAGLSIPTQRALLMLSCVAGAWLLKRNPRPLDTLALAMLAVLIWDPVAVLSAGFWFSFLAVGVILYVFSGRIAASRRWLQWSGLQISIALALFPLSLLLFQQTSLVSPLANLIMVPYVSFLVVPLVLMALLLMPVSSTLADALLRLANGLLEFIWPLLDALAQQSFAYWAHAAAGIGVVVLALLGVALLLAPRGIPARWLGLLLIVPVVSNAPVRPVAGAFELHLLDVGQGLAAIVQTQHHVLVYDTGARFSDKFNSGDAVVVPYLRHLAVAQLDKLIISHGDNDHIGGAEAVLEAFPATQIIGRDIEPLVASHKAGCVQGERWHWDGVDFEFLHPQAIDYSKPNNRSCVLKVSGQGGSLLLTGDIERKIEKSLLKHSPSALAADVLVVPHHGSKSSSTPAFIAAVQPDIALFPVGYRNRYRLPNKDVLARYTDQKAKLVATGVSGAIRIQFDPISGVSAPQRYRQSHRKYWNSAARELRQ